MFVVETLAAWSAVNYQAESDLKGRKEQYYFTVTTNSLIFNWFVKLEIL